MSTCRKIRELVMENTDLKNALVEHQDALEYIMGKYRYFKCHILFEQHFKTN